MKPFTAIARSLLMLLALVSAVRADGLFERAAEESLADKVVVIHIGQEDLVNKQAFRFWHRTLERAESEGARAVVIEIDTPGGLAFDTRAIITDDLAKLELPIFAWVEREALSAGALIAFTADRIYMAPGTTIGSAGLVNTMGEIEPVMRAKLESAFEATMRTVTEKKGHRIEVLRAMMFVDEEKERTFGSVTVRKGGLLNLTASEAVQEVDGKPLLAAGIASSLDELLEAEGLSDVPVIRPAQTGFERFAWWVAAISPLLIAIGVGAAWFELKAPGFGIFGFVSLAAFGLFFFGNNVAGNLAGYELTALFVGGVVLILLEIFVLPGMVAGILGGLMVIASLWLGMADKIDFEQARETGSVFSSLDELLVRPALLLSAGLLGALVLGLLFARYLPKIPLFRGLVAEQNLDAGPPAEHRRPGSLVGRYAVALTDLRPGGTIEIDGEKKDALSRHGLIEKGSRVRILEEGMTFVVEPAS